MTKPRRKVETRLIITLNEGDEIYTMNVDLPEHLISTGAAVISFSTTDITEYDYVYLRPDEITYVIGQDMYTAVVDVDDEVREASAAEREHELTQRGWDRVR